jgi:dynactin 1
VLQQLQSCVQTCTPEVLLRVGTLYLDLATQEKTLDNMLELLRKDQLDENVPLEGLEKCVGVLQTMLGTHLPDFKPEPSLLLRECCRALQSAADGFYTDASAAHALITVSQPEMTIVSVLLWTNSKSIV